MILLRPAFVAEVFAGAVEVLHARVHATMAEEVEVSRPYWIAGVPTEMDVAAAHKAVARRLKTTPETVVAMLTKPVPQPEE